MAEEDDEDEDDEDEDDDEERAMPLAPAALETLLRSGKSAKVDSNSTKTVAVGTKSKFDGDKVVQTETKRPKSSVASAVATPPAATELAAFVPARKFSGAKDGYIFKKGLA